jgi:hypothetical protein
MIGHSVRLGLTMESVEKINRGTYGANSQGKKQSQG